MHSYKMSSQERYGDLSGAKVPFCAVNLQLHYITADEGSLCTCSFLPYRDDLKPRPTNNQAQKENGESILKTANFLCPLPLPLKGLFSC